MLPLPRSAVFLRLPAVWVFLAALAAHSLVLLAFRESPFYGAQSGDMGFYNAWAERILGGEWTDRHAFYGMPGYAYLLAAMYGLFGANFLPIFFLQAMIDSGTAVIIFTITREILAFETKKDAPSSPDAIQDGFSALAALGWIVFVPAQTFTVVLMPTVWVIFGFWLIVFRLIPRGETSMLRPWAPLGFFMGLMATMIATILFLIPLGWTSIAATVRSGQRWKHRAWAGIIAAAVLATGVAAGTAPVWFHNYFVAHDPVLLSAHGGINFWIGNSPEANGYPKVPKGLRAGQEELLQDSITIAEAAAGRPLQRREVSAYWSKKAWDQIHADPARWVRLLGLKVRNFWNAYVYDDVTIIALLREEGVLLPGISFGAIALFGAAGLVRGILRNGPARWVASAVLLQMFALLPVFITERYRMAAAPGLLILGSYGLFLCYMDVRQNRWAPAAGQFVLLGAASAAVYLPKTDAPRAMEPYNLAIAELEAGQLDRAQGHLEKVEAIAPGDPSLLASMGTLWLKKGNLNKAKAYYARASSRDPRNFEVLFNEGIVAMQERQWRDAERFLRQAIALQRDPDAFFLLAQTQSKASKLAEAHASLEEAIRLAPRRGFQRFREHLASPSLN